MSALYVTRGILETLEIHVVDNFFLTMTSIPAVAGTLQTDPRSGGIKRSSGVNVLPSVAEGECQYRG